ncbi:uncharacterized protein [Prorops nasuta]|uniref:uncharacterized protein n=1 Tax=Prorops nasuta TaxID=863751 RepID=UPI0034CF7287
MFRDGQYLEVIKVSDNCLGTAVVTVREKIMEIRNKKVPTNKWLNLEDWATVYKIIEKALLVNSNSKSHRKDLEKCEWKKSTRRLEITYTFEFSECPKDHLALPTIKAIISPAKRKFPKDKPPENINKTNKTKIEFPTITNCKSKSKIKKYKDERSARISQMQNVLEEYIPDGPTIEKSCSTIKYIPSKKSSLQSMQISDEYVPSPTDYTTLPIVPDYIPNSVDHSTVNDAYEPLSFSTEPSNFVEEYVPNSKGVINSVEAYEPYFPSKTMKFDTSYVPSSTKNNSIIAKASKGAKKILRKDHDKSVGKKKIYLST